MDLDGTVHFTTTLFALIREVSEEHLLKGIVARENQPIGFGRHGPLHTTLFALIREVSGEHLLKGQ